MNRETLNKRLNLGALAATLLVAAAGMPVLAAQPETPPEKELKGSFDQPLGGAGAQGGAQAGSQSTTVMQSSDGNDSYKVEISGGKVKAWHNDKAISKDRIRKSKDKIELLDKEGNVEHTFEVGGFGAAAGGAGGIEVPGGRFFFRAPNGGEAGGPETPQPPQPPAGVRAQNMPPVMLGINMTDADEGMLDELDQKDVEEAIVVDRVMEGLPADKAGLKVHDLIVEVQGHRSVSAEKLREILHDRKPGDEITFKVFRDKKPIELKIRLEKFDAAKLSGGNVVIGRGEGQGQQPTEFQRFPEAFRQFGEAGKGQMDEARKAIEKAMRELHENENLKPEKLRGETQKALEKALKALADAEKSGQMQWRRFLDENGKEVPQSWMFTNPDQPDQIFTKRVQPGQRGDSDTGRKLDKLGEQLDRLNKRLDELERRLDQKAR